MKKLAILILVLAIACAGCRSAPSSSADPVPPATTVETAGQTNVSTPAMTEPSQSLPPAESPTPALTETTTSETSVSETQPTPVATTSAKETAAELAGEYLAAMKRDLLVLLVAYPDDVTGVTREDGQVYLVMKSSQKILYDDKKMKSADDMLADADIQDTLATGYPLGEVHAIMADGLDPGRCRSYPLLDELCGSSKAAITKRLTTVAFGEQQLPFSTAASAAAHLEQAAAQIALLVEQDPAIADDVYPSSGTFNYRDIAGTSRLSMHAYGLAIDMRSQPDDYWRWTSEQAGAARISGYPASLVRTMEENGFIWGGKWHHFDIMHYEYRPELILKARYFPSAIDLHKPWYEGADLDDGQVLRAIDLVDAAIG